MYLAVGRAESICSFSFHSLSLSNFSIDSNFALFFEVIMPAKSDV